MRYELHTAEEVPGEVLQFDVPEGAIILRFLTRADFGRNAVEYLVPTRVIVVNGKKRSWGGKEITYREVAALAHPVDADEVLFTVTYHRKAIDIAEWRPEDKQDGSLTRGEKARVSDGMIFVVSDTSRA